MRVLLTGGSGFIGQTLLPLLAHHDLLVISRKKHSSKSPNLSYVQGNLSEPAQWETAVKKFSPQVCIHLAWTGIPDYSFTRCLQNFDASLHLFSLLDKVGCGKVFAAGSVWEYGDRHGALRETVPPGSMNLFASFKTAIRTTGESWAKENNINFIWGRIFFVYGPHQRSEALIPTCYQAFKSKLKLDIKNPNAENDFIYVSDVAKAIVALVDTPTISGTFNIGTGNATKVTEVCNLIAKTLNADNPFPSTAILLGETCPRADISSINEKTGWSPEVTMKEGINKTIQFLEKNDGSS